MSKTIRNYTVKNKKTKSKKTVNTLKVGKLILNNDPLNFYEIRSIPITLNDNDNDINANTNKDPFIGICLFDSANSNIDVIKEVEYLSMQLYNKIDVEKFVNENEGHISRFVSFKNRWVYQIVEERMLNTPTTKDVLINFLVLKIHAYVDYYLKHDRSDPYNMFDYLCNPNKAMQSRNMLCIVSELVKNNINKSINIYKEFSLRSNKFTLRDLCFFIYGLKGLQLFNTLELLNIDECSFEFWNNIKDGILLESITRIDNIEQLPEIDFNF